jgi:transcriptional regulator of arginine metabolism
MITKNRRLAIIAELVNTHSPNSQGKLLKLLHEKGFTITQTTLSRDVKQLKISKMPDEKGNYVYMIAHQDTNSPNRHHIKDKTVFSPNRGFISIEFSNQLGVIKTRQGYASGMALDIDSRASSVILGSIADDNTILLIPREGVSRQDVINALATIIPGIKKEDETSYGES